MNDIILANNSGFCFGVNRAVNTALDIKNKYNKKIYTLGPLIHNMDVVNYLQKNDIYSIEIEDIYKLSKGDVIIIRSHGVSSKIHEMLKEKGLIVIDATCPYVFKIHEKVKKYYELGYDIIIVGDKNHPEVIGINGWCNNSAIISKAGENLDNISSKVCVVSQTTENQENWHKVLNIIVEKCREILAFNTICKATKVRQKSAQELSKKADLMVVIGGHNSSNTTKLYEICKKECKNTIYIENSNELSNYVHKLKKAKIIGVTAGASTPDWIIKEAILKMNEEKNLGINEQLAYMEENDQQIFVGEVIEGTVISVNEEEVFLNIGYKADGLLPIEEIAKKEDESLPEMFKEDDEVTVKVISRRNEDGYVVLSTIELERDKAYDELNKAFEEKESINVTVKKVVKGGLIAEYRGVRIFIPASHVELFHVDNLNKYVGENLEVKIIEFNENKRGTRVVASRRDILKAEKAKKEEATWQSLNKDDIVEGEVKRLTDFGAFVDVNGVDGLLHVSQISWGRVEKPSDVLKIGEKIKVIILDIDREEKKLSLSIKALTENPWNNVDIKYPVGNIVLGKVVRFANFGAFVELEPGVDALVHISEISHERINKPSDVLEINQQVKAKILDVDKEAKKIGLSIKEAN